MSLKRGVLNSAGMLLLAVAVFYSLEYWPQRMPLLPAAVTGERPQTDPDYTITEFHAIDLDEQGRLRYELAAERLVHYADPERAELSAPDMIFYRNDARNPDTAPAAPGDAAAPTAAEAGDAPAGIGAPGALTDPWQLTARSGRISDGGERLDLTGDVKVARMVADDAARMTMEAPQLTVFGRAQVAATDGPVVLRSAQAELTGVGMKIDMKQGRMHLLSQVRGHYDPQ